MPYNRKTLWGVVKPEGSDRVRYIGLYRSPVRVKKILGENPRSEKLKFVPGQLELKGSKIYCGDQVVSDHPIQAHWVETLEEIGPIHSCGTNLPSTKNGPGNQGSQRYFCPDCLKVWTLQPKKVGRPLLGEKRLTQAEKDRRYREKKQTRSH